MALPLSVAEPYTIETDDWRSTSPLCPETRTPDLWALPCRHHRPRCEQIEQAKAVCRECLAQSACLDFALVTNQDSGVWGGTSEEERRKLRKAWLARQRRTA